MKFGQLIGCYMRNIFLEKSYTKCGGWTSPRSFSEKLKLNILWINSLSFYTVCFYCMQSWGPSKYMKTNLKTTCFYLILSFFLHNLKKKIFLLLHSIKLTKFHCLVAFTSWDVGQDLYCNCLLTRLWRHKFSSQPYLSNQVFFPAWPKRHVKNLNT